MLFASWASWHVQQCLLSLGLCPQQSHQAGTLVPQRLHWALHFWRYSQIRAGLCVGYKCVGANGSVPCTPAVPAKTGRLSCHHQYRQHSNYSHSSLHQQEGGLDSNILCKLATRLWQASSWFEGNSCLRWMEHYSPLSHRLMCGPWGKGSLPCGYQNWWYKLCKSLCKNPLGLPTCITGDCLAPDACPTRWPTMRLQWRSSCSSCNPNWRRANQQLPCEVLWHWSRQIILVTHLQLSDQYDHSSGVNQRWFISTQW